MVLFLYAVGIAQIVLGLATFGAAVGAMHEMTAATLFGFGVVSMALGSINQAMARTGFDAKPTQASGYTSPYAEHRVGDVMKRYKGYEIVKANGGVSADGRHFAGIISAEKHIDSLQEPQP